jgi:predicted dehydrogenase
MTMIRRRRFLEIASAGSLAVPFSAAPKPVRVGVIGTGRRGAGLLRILLEIPGVQVPAVCDSDPERLAAAAAAIENKGQVVEKYGGTAEAFRKLLARDDLEAVVIAAPWDWHAPMAVAAMKAGKYAGVEVPAAVTLDECWDLVNTFEQTGVPCMLLENDCFGEGALMALTLVEQGVLGEIIHCEGGYQHDIRAGILRDGQLSWRGRHALTRNGDLYPTHPVGPMAWWSNINRGDRFTYLTSTASKSRGINHYIAKYYGADHPHAKTKFALGDVVTTVLKSENGVTVVVSHDTSLPRPYSDSGETKIPLMVIRLQGTEGIFSGSLDRIYIEGRNGPNSKMHKWQDIRPYYERYRHPLWRNVGADASGYAHGGEDYVCLSQFVEAVRQRKPTPIDVYDAACWSAISPLSEQSAGSRSAPVDFPDFTRGKWKTPRRIDFVL